MMQLMTTGSFTNTILLVVIYRVFFYPLTEPDAFIAQKACIRRDIT
jgi:hypothetical protein